MDDGGEGGEGGFGCVLSGASLVAMVVGAGRGGVQDGVEEGVGGDVFLVEETAFGGGASGVVDADVLGDLAGGAGEETQHAVGDDDEAVGKVAGEVGGVGGEEGEGFSSGIEAIRKLHLGDAGHVVNEGEGVVLEDDTGERGAVGAAICSIRDLVTTRA